jgi:UPF0176 protein
MTVTPALLHSAFYKFVPLKQPNALSARVRELAALCGPGLSGSILLATEGVNGMLAGPPKALSAMELALQTDPHFEGAFAGLDFKHSECKTAPFGRLIVRVKAEIVPLGIDGVDATRPSGVQIGPREWRALMRQPDVVLLDNRNSFEYQLGHFHGALDPQVNNFRDFPAFVRARLPQWQEHGKRVAMYCTGGIRCEKTGAWLRDLGLPVYQLQGGILNYFRHMPDAQQDWVGECFVFDNRVALNTRLQETSTTLQDVYATEPEDHWRLQRARRLACDANANPAEPVPLAAQARSH